jgi:hypothetical protein
MKDTLALIGLAAVIIFTVNIIANWRCKVVAKRNEKKNRTKVIGVLILAGTLLLLSGCGMLQKIKQIDDIKHRENCCGDKH